ncbi:MAG: Clp protease ClpP [Candidatus Solibacter sp.]
MPITDQLSNLKGKHLDLVLETPGGFADVTEDIVRLIRQKYDSFAVIIAGWAKSAGTILAMAADEILMGPNSALGPIDAQLIWNNKQFSADALLEGVKKIKQEVQDTGVLNKAYIPILQNISPGELQDAQNALDFATDLVTDWLARYKFKDWNQHADGLPVTPEERTQRAKGIADQLCDHKRWKVHGRSLKIQDLEAMRLKITDYTQEPELEDAVSRYYALMQITFATNIYKLYETPSSQILKTLTPAPGLEQLALGLPPGVQPPAGGGKAYINFLCDKCRTVTALQANLGKPQPLDPGRLLFPRDNKFSCPKCAKIHDLTAARKQLETQAKLPVV